MWECILESGKHVIFYAVDLAQLVSQHPEILYAKQIG